MDKDTMQNNTTVQIASVDWGFDVGVAQELILLPGKHFGVLQHGPGRCMRTLPGKKTPKLFLLGWS